MIQPSLRVLLFPLAFAAGILLANSVLEAGTGSLALGELSLSPASGSSASERAAVRRGALLPGGEFLVEASLEHSASGSFEVSWGVELSPASGGSPRTLGSGSGWRVGPYSDQDLAASVRLPANTRWGRYLLELNVAAGSRRLTTHEFVYVGEAADLELSALRLSTHPAGATLGAGETVGVQVVVANRGRRTAGWTTLDLRFSRNDAITAYDPAGGQIRLAPLSPGESRTENFDLVVPADLAGSYYLGARVDADRDVPELVEGGTARSSRRFAIQAGAAGPDLVAVSVEPRSSTASPGGYLLVDRALRNSGDQASGRLEYALVLSRDNRLGPSDREIWRGTLASLEGGEESVAQVRVRLPANLATGSYRVGIRLDPDDTLPEPDESNNELLGSVRVEISASANLPNLRVVAMRPKTYTTRPGDRLRVERTLENTGSDAGAFSYTLVLSRDQRIDSRDEVIYTYRYYDGLDEGQRRAGTVTATIPSDVRPGNYWVGIRVDPGNEVAESDEDDDQVAAPFAIRVDRGRSVRRFAPRRVYMNDGDTLRVDGQSYRLLGFDTPEKRSGAFTSDQEPYASRATDHARNLLYGAEELALHLGETDLYGRTLAHAFLDGQSMAILMVEAEQAYQTITIFGNGGFYELGSEIVDASRGRTLPFQAPYRWRQRYKR